LTYKDGNHLGHRNIDGPYAPEPTRSAAKLFGPGVEVSEEHEPIEIYDTD
jgi:hypothetical protein